MIQLILVLVLCLSQIKADGCQGLSGYYVNIVANNGGVLARCNKCGPAAYSDSVVVHDSKHKNGDYAIWYLVSVGDKCALVSDTNHFAARCNNCWHKGAYPDAVFNHVKEHYPAPAYALWKVVKHADNTYSFQADTGRYMARCNGCVGGGAYPNFAFVHATAASGAALWKIDIVRQDGCLGLGGKSVVIVADNGGILARCNHCGSAAYANSVVVHASSAKGQSYATWHLESQGDKCVLISDIKYLAARCNGCWSHGAYPDAVFDHVKESDPAPAYAQWKVARHGDKYSFQADTGRYMARCNGCVSGGAYPNFAFVHATSPVSYALWTVDEL